MSSKASIGLASAFAVIGALYAADPAWAGSKIFSSGSTVATVNGTVETNVSQNRDPFVAQVFTTGAECLRIAVTSQGQDLKATLISPSGTIWQDDDSGGLNRPLIKAVTNVRGWYPLTLSHWSGASVNADFTMTVQRAAATSSLCAPATAPRAAIAAAASKSGSNGPKPVGGPN